MPLRDYTSRDITGLRNHLVSLIDKIYETYGMGGWTDRNESDLGMVFLELAAGVTDMLDYYVDKQALENYLPTVTARRNLKRIVDLVGYEMEGPKPSRTTAVITLERHMDFDFTIPKYFQVSYSRPGLGNIYYATATDAFVPAGSTAIRVALLQGIVRTVNLTASDLRRSRKLTVESSDVDTDSIILTIDGEEWERVPDVLVDDVFGKKYSVYEDIDDRPVIEMGYHWLEYLPDDPLAPVEVKFLSTEGAHGKVSAGRIDTIESTLMAGGRDVSSFMKVSNLVNATDGYDREDMETARIRAPHVRHSKGRLTTLGDFEDFCGNIDGILKSKAIDWTVESGRWIGVPYQVSVYILPNDDDAYTFSDSFRQEVKDLMRPYLWCSIDLAVVSAVIRDIDIDITVTTSTEKINVAGLRQELEEMYRDFFKKERRSFGEKFTVGQLENIAKQSNLVDTVTMEKPTSVIDLDPMEFPRLNDLNITIVGGTTRWA